MRKNRSVSNCNASSKPSIFDKNSSQFSFVPLRAGEIDAKQTLATQLTCRNLSSYKLTEGIHTLQKNFLVYYRVRVVYVRVLIRNRRACQTLQKVLLISQTQG